LFAALDKLTANGTGFVVTYDICGSKDWKQQMDASVEGLAKLRKFFREDNRTLILQKAKSAAVLVRGNIFVEATISLLRRFLDVLAPSPSCPFLVCHSEAAAEEFFRVAIGAATPCFVSVVGVQPMRKTSNGSETCVASLAPLSKATCGNLKTHAEAPSTYHMLPNGDVRVIQSPPCDIVMGQPVTSVPEEGIADVPTKTGSAGALCRGDLPSVAALLFKGPTESLRRLIGAHFHVGELVADAEMESLSRRCRGSVRKQGKGCVYDILSALVNAFLADPRKS
jgi:hypothetical protein